MKNWSFFFFFLVCGTDVFAQGCCSGGTGSPIAGGASQGVLLEKQIELSSSFQYVSSNQFMSGDRDTMRMFQELKSDYLYSRVAYGVTKKLTLSAEVGYYFARKQIGLGGQDTVQSSGIGDLILFPRYEVYSKKTEKHKTEFVVGLGYKIPLGKYNDSTVIYTNPYNNKQYYAISPPTIQPTSGAQDFIFYGFIFRENIKWKTRFFVSTLYIKKGWNPLSQKMGDYASIGLFVNRSFYKKRIGVTLQIKGEHVAKMKYNKELDMLALYNIDPESTGNDKVFFVPQLSYNYKNFTVYGLSEIPLYQYFRGMQIASRQLFTFGLTYRFMVSKKFCEPEPEKI